MGWGGTNFSTCDLSSWLVALRSPDSWWIFRSIKCRPIDGSFASPSPLSLPKHHFGFSATSLLIDYSSIMHMRRTEEDNYSTKVWRKAGRKQRGRKERKWESQQGQKGRKERREEESKQNFKKWKDRRRKRKWVKSEGKNKWRTNLHQ